MGAFGWMWTLAASISQGGAVGASVFVVAENWLSPWAADRDPLGQVQLLWMWFG